MIDYKIKQNDLVPSVRSVLRDEAGVIDLSSASALKFFMVNVDTGALKVNGANGIFVDRPNGVVEYTWSGTDTDTVGNYRAEFEVTFPEGKETFPSHTYIYIEVLDDLG